MIAYADAYLPKNLNSAPQIENEEDNWLVVHLLQATKNDEENKIPSDHLMHKQKLQTYKLLFVQDVYSWSSWPQESWTWAKGHPVYLYESWNNTCPDYTKSSIEDLYWCQDLAEEHHIRYCVKCVIEGIWKEF